MKIQTNSWHCRLVLNEYNLYGRDDITNSCQYITLFLITVFTISMKALGILVTVLLIGIVAVPLLLLMALSTLLFVPEMIYQAAYGESLYQIVVTLSGGSMAVVKQTRV